MRHCLSISLIMTIAQWELRIPIRHLTVIGRGKIMKVNSDVRKRPKQRLDRTNITSLATKLDLYLHFVRMAFGVAKRLPSSLSEGK